MNPTFAPNRPVPTPAQLRPRRPITRVPAPPAATDAWLTVASSVDLVVWVVILDAPAHDTMTITGHAASLDDGCTAALAALQRATNNTPVHLFTNRRQVADAAADVDAMTVFPLSLHKHHRLGAEGHRRLAAELQSARAEAPRLDVAVDGSWARFTRVGAWAVLGADGTHRTGALRRAAGPVVCELQAIRQSLLAHPGPRRLLVLCDSREAIDLARHPQHAPVALRPLAIAVNNLLRGRDVDLAWTKGHQGPGLHDGADRLAVQARRAHEFGTPAAVAQAIAQLIVTESIDAHHKEGPDGHALAA